MKPRLLERYRKDIIPGIMQKHSLKNRLEVPSLNKIVINVGLGEGAQDIKILEAARDELAKITGQTGIITKAKKAIANFKIKRGSAVGCKVTLRRAKMYEFLDRLINIAIPRIKDFRGLNPDSFDEAGNYSFGINEQTIFPEIDIDKIPKIHGMDIIITINNGSKERSFDLLKHFGMPFKAKE
jgi:large subunit ribosomal protein L5